MPECLPPSHTTISPDRKKMTPLRYPSKDNCDIMSVAVEDRKEAF